MNGIKDRTDNKKYCGLMPEKQYMRDFGSLKAMAMHMRFTAMKRIHDKNTRRISNNVLVYYRDEFHEARKKVETAKKVSEQAVRVKSDTKACYVVKQHVCSFSDFKTYRKHYFEAKRKSSSAKKALEKAEDVMAAKMNDYWAAKHTDPWVVLRHYQTQSGKSLNKPGESRESKKR